MEANMRNVLVFIMLIVICESCDAIILIDQNTRNGSFETGQWYPWHFYDNVLVNDASFASDGMYYAKLETTTGRKLIFQRDFSIDKNIGPAFTFQVDVRNGINPFDELDVAVSGRTYDGKYVSGSPSNIFVIPAEAANSWVTITGTETFSAADWQELDVSTLGFTIQLDKKNWVNGELLQGFLDNIVLIQTPEPGTLLLLGLGGIFLRGRKF
jgi:hypothetical protein